MDESGSLSCRLVLRFFLRASISASLIGYMYNSNLVSWVAYLAFKANDLKVASWKCVLKLLATCQRQYLWTTHSRPSSSLGQFAIAFWIPLCRSEIMQMSLSAITSSSEILKRSKNHPQQGPDSLSITTKARDKTLLLASVTIAINNTPRYLPYKWVPSILITGLQCLNPSMHGAKTQNT